MSSDQITLENNYDKSMRHLQLIKVFLNIATFLLDIFLVKIADGIIDWFGKTA